MTDSAWSTREQLLCEVLGDHDAGGGTDVPEARAQHRGRRHVGVGLGITALLSATLTVGGVLLDPDEVKPTTCCGPVQM